MKTELQQSNVWEGAAKAALARVVVPGTTGREALHLAHLRLAHRLCGAGLAARDGARPVLEMAEVAITAVGAAANGGEGAARAALAQVVILGAT